MKDTTNMATGAQPKTKRYLTNQNLRSFSDWDRSRFAERTRLYDNPFVFRPSGSYSRVTSALLEENGLFSDFSFDVGIGSSDYRVDENTANRRRLEYLNRNITPLFLSLIKNDDTDFGYKGPGARLVEEQLLENAVATQHWFNQLYIRYFATDEKVLLGLLKVIESLDYESLSPISETIALASLAHKSDEVKELGVRIFENWGTPESYKILKSVRTDTPWLKSYIDQVIEDLAKTLCLY